MRRGDWMQTYTGRQFWPLDPQPDEIDILDIAHSLSMQCRYNGHCKQFYSVAEHCWLLSHAASKPNQLAALLHDAAEAYLCDLPRPVKPYIEGYSAAERVVEAAVARKFGVAFPLHAEIKELDCRILLDERDQIMATPPADWNLPFQPLGVTLHCWSPERAERQFLARFRAIAVTNSSNAERAG